MRKSTIRKLIFSFLIISPFVLIQCTSNPLDSDQISSKYREITGQVKLSDKISPDNVYLYLEGLDVGTYSDAEGKFELQIPSPNSQSGGGLTGAFNLYYFSANYKLDSAKVVLHKGQIQLDKGDLNADGEIKTIKTLQKLANVKINLDPKLFPVPAENNNIIAEICNFNTGWEKPMSVILDINTLNESVVVQYPNLPQGPTALVYLEKIGTDQKTIYTFSVKEVPGEINLMTESLSHEARTWITGYQINEGDLPVGTYRVMPYFLIHQSGVPDELLNNLLSDLENPAQGVLNIPMKCQADLLTIEK